MTVCVHVAFGITAFAFVLCTAVPDNMCLIFASQTVKTNYTFYYEPWNDTCCCSLRWTNNSPSFAMSSFHVQCRKNKSVIIKTTPQVPLTTVLPSTRDTEVSTSAEPTETTNHNDGITSVAPLPSTSIGHTKEQKTTAHVLLTTESPSTTDSEISSSAEPVGTTSLSDGITTVVPIPSTSIGRTKVHVKMCYGLSLDL